MASDDIPTVTVSQAAISAASAAAEERVAVWGASLPDAAKAAARAVGTECYVQGYEQAQIFKCAAWESNTGAGDPAECDWPLCGCDEQATKVLEALTEMGWGPLPAAAQSDKGDSHA